MKGLAVAATQPYFLDTQGSLVTGSSHGFSVTVYDALGRPIETHTSDPNGLHQSPAMGSHASIRAARTTIAYSGIDKLITNDKGQAKREEYDLNGQLIRVTDPLGAQIGYQYNAFGDLIRTRDALQNTISITANLRGWKMALSDPDSGLTAYDYNALGEPVWQQSANQRAQGGTVATSYTYDALGRQTQRIEAPYISPGSINSSYTSTWSYDKYADGSACAMGVGKLCEARTDNGVSRKLVYDAIGRAQRSQLSISGGPTFTNAVSYSAVNGRVADRTYPSGLKITYGYTGLGYLERLLNGNTSYWQAQSINAWGLIERQQAGNGVPTVTTYDAALGRTADIAVGSGAAVFHHSYQYDSLANLAYRADANGAGSARAVTENYSYDDLNRLIQYSVSGPDLTKPSTLSRSVALTYNAAGMLLYKSDVGSYSYSAGGTAQAHALRALSGAAASTYAYDANGNLATSSAGKYRSVAYTSFDLPDSSLGLLGADGTRYTWSYDTEHARIKEVRQNASGTRTTWEVHPDSMGGLGFEQEIITGGAITNRHYLTAYGQTVGMVTTKGAITTPTNPQSGDASAVVAKVEYWHKDSLGSISAITDAAGAVVQQLAYDPFGKRRATNGNYDVAGALVIDNAQGTDRGYTGHEQLDDVGVVHANGRLYDALTSRFMQADPLVGQADNLQNFNRYGYVLNNPLNATDPSGFDQTEDYNDNYRIQHRVGGGAVEFTYSFAGWETTMSTDKFVDDRTVQVNGPRPLVPNNVVAPRPALGGYQNIDTPFKWVGNSGGASRSATNTNWTGGQTRNMSPSQVVDTLVDGAKNDSVVQTMTTVVVAGKKVSADLYNWAFGDTQSGAAAKADLQANWVQYGNGLIVLGNLRRGGGGKPPIKAGAAGGQTAGKAFPKSVKDAAKAENPLSTCVYCLMEGTGTQVDHAVPRARGGDATLENAQMACPHCNPSKGAGNYPINPPPGYRGDWPPDHW